MAIEKIWHGMQWLNPVRQRLARSKKKRANNVVGSAKDAFRLTILWGKCEGKRDEDEYRD